MVGRQILALVIGVRLPVPEPCNEIMCVVVEEKHFLLIKLILQGVAGG